METIAPLASEERAALHEALADEYRALATYQQVLADFGPVRPFVNIRDAEARHAEALEALCRKYDVERPAGNGGGQVPRFASVQEACRAGVQGEIDNGAMYERLLGVARHTDVRSVFLALQAASRDHHLPAFRRCVERPREAGASDGGAGRRRRWRGGR
jgi:rubrerythrin